jgi:hypothetical protein
MKKLLPILFLLAVSSCNSPKQSRPDQVGIAEACMRYYLSDWLDSQTKRNFVTFCDFTRIGVSTEEVAQRLTQTCVIIKDISKASKNERMETWDSNLKANGEFVILKDLSIISDTEAEITLVYGGAPTYGGRLIYVLKRKHGHWSVISRKINRLSHNQTTEPNKAPETRHVLVTFRAFARPAPSTCLSHL